MWKRTVVSYTISYNTNGGTPSSITATTGTAEPSASIQLTGTVPTKSGYKFKGWCTVNPGTSTDCSGNLYSSGGQYPLSNGYNVMLFALWGKLEYGDACNSTGKVLKDGKCWRTYNSSSCPNGWNLATRSEVMSLLTAYGINYSGSGCVYTYSGSMSQLSKDLSVSGSQTFGLKESCLHGGTYYISVFYINGGSYVFDGNTSRPNQSICISNI